MNIRPTDAQTEELNRLGDEIAELSAHLDAATARLLDLIREFDARGGWSNGFRSCAAWLSWRVGFSPGAAREHVRVARALGTLPRLSKALARGELSYAKVRELTRVAIPETEERLLAVGRAGTAEHVERIIRGWPTPTGPGGRGSKTGCASRPERRGAGRAMRAGSLCATTPTGVSRRSAPGPARFRQRYGERSTTGTAAAASRAAASGSARVITS